ncbi:hypothetical protein ACVWWK_003397 [Bradyrhizobium sp. LB9.1b]
MSLNSMEETASRSNPFVKHGPGEQELVDAIRITTERDGGLWLASALDEGGRSYRGQELERQIIARGRKIDILRKQAVRLAAFIHACDGSDYWNVLYSSRIPRLRASHFREVALASQSRLGDNFAADGNRVHFLSVGLALHGDAFSLTFEKMPLVAGFLDFLHNALGFDHVKERLKLLFQSLQRPHAADEVDAALGEDLELWFKDKLKSEHYIGKAREIRRFLSELTFDRLQPFSLLDNIDDNAIFSFWTRINTQTPDIASHFGFLLYKSAAQSMLDYRAALVLSSERKNIEAAKALVDEEGNEIELQGSDGRDPLDDFAEGEVRIKADAWFSPLAALCVPPSDGVKWIMGKKLKFASGILTAGSGRDALFRNDRPDPKFWLTLLRYLCFGNNENAGDYLSVRAEVRDFIFDLKALLKATAHVLLLRSKAAAIPILEDIEPGIVKRLEPVLAAALTRAIAEREQRGVDQRFIEAGTKALLLKMTEHLQRRDSSTGKIVDPTGRELEAAYYAINRQGFRKEDEADSSFDEPFDVGSSYLSPLVAEFERTADWFHDHNLDTLFADDSLRFEVVYSTLYRRDQMTSELI